MADAYLDTSALVKRYVQEPGTIGVDIILDKAHLGDLVIATSLWNLGEAFGVIDHRRRRRLLTEHEFSVVVRNLTNEVVGLVRTGALQVYSVRASLLTEAWSLILSHHLYQADALQIATCIKSQSKVLITGDELLRRECEDIGLKALDPHKQERDISGLFG